MSRGNISDFNDVLGTLLPKRRVKWIKKNNGTVVNRDVVPPDDSDCTWVNVYIVTEGMQSPKFRDSGIIPIRRRIMRINYNEPAAREISLGDIIVLDDARFVVKELQKLGFTSNISKFILEEEK